MNPNTAALGSVRWIIASLMILPACSVPAALQYRWSFNQAAGNATAGTTISDSIASHPIVVRGQGATFDGSRIVLPGTSAANLPEASISAYLDLPNGIVSSRTDLTLEFWAAPLGARNWAPLFDFGRWTTPGDGLGEPGEWTGNSTETPPSTQTESTLALLLNRGSNLNQQRLSIVRDNTGIDLDTELPTTAGQIYHYVVTVEDGVGSYGAGGMRVAWYRDGTLIGFRDAPYHLADIEDVNCWLGRLQWSALEVANVAYDEFRLYDHAFDPSEVISSREAGPNVILGAPLAMADNATLHHGQKVLISVLENDTGSINPDSVSIVDPPQFGDATVDAIGRVLYHHTTGAPESDQFSYTVSGSGGTSDPVYVTLQFATGLRLANANLNVPDAPPATTYETEPAFGALTFNQPINLAHVPGDAQRLFVVERQGTIRLIPDVTAATPTSSLFLNLAGLLATRGEAIGTTYDQGLMSMAIHPQHASNGHFFVFYSVRVNATGNEYFRISRFTTLEGDPNAADPSSELVLIQQLDPNGYHLGTDMHFGIDGYLYISTGDGGGQNDSRRYGQRIDGDFHCALLRIDVDKLPENPEPNLHPSVPRDEGVARYSIPDDNPFVTAGPTVSFNGQSLSATSVRTEFFSVGLRNPFRFSIDPPTGEIWVGDVGQNAREEINLAVNGGNFGWSWREGTLAGPNAGEALPGFSSINPLYEYQIGNGEYQGHSVTGGFVYRGTQIPALNGAYIFGDYVDGHLWALRRTPEIEVERLTGDAGQVAFGPDPSNGDVLMVDIQEGRIQRLVVGEDVGDFPATLSETGLFADLTDLSPAPGLLPYAPNLSFWSDHARKRRWFIIPDAANTITWERDDPWTFPAGMIWVKHFDLETVRGVPESARRIETRLLVKTEEGSYGVSYQWNEEETEATLVPDGGADLELDVMVGESPTTQLYRIPSRGECVNCHNPGAGHALSFNMRQLNRSQSINGFDGNQLALLEEAGYFSNDVESPNLLPRHLRPDETDYPIEARVRSYLDVNCANCHQPNVNGAPASFDARGHIPLTATQLINGAALQNNGDPANRLVVPGDPTHSIVLNRVAEQNGFSRMPPIGSRQLDQTAIDLLTEWIGDSLPHRQSYQEWRVAQFGSPDSPEGAPGFDADEDGASNESEFVGGTDPQDESGFPVLDVHASEGQVSVELDLPSNRSFRVWTSPDLHFWRPWDVPGNGGLPTGGMPNTLIGEALEEQQFFNAELWEN